MQIWWRLTAFGDSTVHPADGRRVAVWLLACHASRRTGWFWVIAMLVDGGGVWVSKVLYMAWGLHPPGLDFIGLSGHSALAFLFWPVLGTLAAGRLSIWRWLGVVVGAALTAGVGQLTARLARALTFRGSVGKPVGRAGRRGVAGTHAWWFEGSTAVRLATGTGADSAAAVAAARTHAGRLGADSHRARHLAR